MALRRTANWVHYPPQVVKGALRSGKKVAVARQLWCGGQPVSGNCSPHTFGEWETYRDESMSVSVRGSLCHKCGHVKTPWSVRVVDTPGLNRVAPFTPLPKGVDSSLKPWTDTDVDTCAKQHYFHSYYKCLKPSDFVLRRASLTTSPWKDGIPAMGILLRLQEWKTNV